MLKWTVSKRADPTESISVSDKATSRRSLGNLPIRNRDLREHRRKSLGSSAVTRRYLNQNKENQIVATPHPITQRTTATTTSTSTPFTKLEFALRDVSNRTPTQVSGVNVTPGRKRNLPPSPVVTRTMPPQQRQTYASTLPTLDLEYSPCGIKSGPLIALRGLTVPDTFFGNACYFRDDMPPASKRLKFTPEITPLSRRLSELRFSKMSIKRNMNNNNNNFDEEDDTNISSKALNDTELDKMIDEILESSRKIKHSSIRRYSPPTAPASTIKLDSRCDPDTVKFDTFCDNLVLSPTKILEAANHTIILEDPATFNEREVRTPPDTSMEVDENVIEMNANENECHLRRQKGVRRKHNIKTKKQTDSPPTTGELMRQNSFLRKSIDLLACMNTPKDLRPDSEDRASMKNRCHHTSIGSKSSYESTPGIEATDVQGSSTPTGSQTTIRRCLTFSESPDSMEDSMEKRKSVASSTTSRCSKSAIISGSLDLAITLDEQKIQIHGELV